MRGISWLAASQSAAQEGLCTMEWVSKYVSNNNNNSERFSELVRHSGAHSTSYSKDNGNFFPVIKRPGREVNHSSSSVTRVRMGGVLRLYGSVVWTGTALRLALLLNTGFVVLLSLRSWWTAGIREVMFLDSQIHDIWVSHELWWCSLTAEKWRRLGKCLCLQKSINFFQISRRQIPADNKNRVNCLYPSIIVGQSNQEGYLTVFLMITNAAY